MNNKDEFYTGDEYVTRHSTYSNGAVAESVILESGPRFLDKVMFTSSEGDHHTPNPYTLETQRVNFPIGINEQLYEHSRGEPRTDRYVRRGCVGFGTAIPTLPVDYHSYNKALSDLNEKVRGTLDISVNLAQSSQMIRMFNVYKSAKRYALRADWRSIVRGVSGAWLEFTYGWKPLISDIYTAAEELQRKADNLVFKFFKGRATVMDTIQSHQDFQFYGRIYYSVPVSHRCEIKIRLKKSFDPTASRWTSLNPVSIAWELVPYSFVVDWFVNIGGFLRDTETALLYNSQFLDGYVTQSSRINHKYQLNQSRATPASGLWTPKSTYTVNVTGSVERLRKTRTLLHSYPLPNRPSVTAGLSSHRLLNAAALIGNLIKQAKK